MILRILIEICFVLLLCVGLRLMLTHRKKDVLTRKLKGLALILCDCAALLAIFYVCRHSVFVVPLPEGRLHWSTEHPEDALLCVPAAYSDPQGKIIGQYVKDGKMYNKLHPYTGRTSLKNGVFYADYRWLSNEGFQQHTLVLDSVPKNFTDRRFKVRRALCKNGSGVYLVQSHLPMTLNSFARKLATFSTNAVNLDMGHLGYGYFKYHGVTIPLSAWTFFNRNQQTNWIYVE